MNVLCSSVVLGGENEGEMNCDIPANTVGFSNVEFISTESFASGACDQSHILPLGRTMRVILQFTKCSLSG